MPMLRLLLALVLVVTPLTAAIDSVSMGKGYVNQVWYRPNTTNTTAPLNSWHLGFQSGQSATIIANDALTGFKIFLVPNSTAATYATVDTTGMDAWTPLYNVMSSWTGALNSVANPKNIFDYGWGTYSITSHTLVGSRVFVVVLGPNDVWKLLIEEWSGFNYTFKYARIDGSEPHTGNVTMNGLVEKEFIYWSFATHSTSDHEPPKDNWDVTIYKYTDSVSIEPGVVVPYPVTGIIARPDVKLAKAVGADPLTLPAPAAAEFDSNATLIGWDWKTFDTNTGQYTIEDSTAYFLLRPDGTMWRMVITGFVSGGGNGTGTITFNADAVTTSVAHETAPTDNVLGVHPNMVAHSELVNVVVHASAPIASVTIVDAHGREVRTISSGLDAGMHVLPVATSALASGMYRIVLHTSTAITSAPLVVR